ncbi:uncharacterized protein LOC132469020 [Gadus macrocephalus]|uniref:uncharacterized protein LOC132469020 n=1 Tax=Gadus macrocephalus TaxID=80720 RepID=UPI0028CB3F27|nr:uncharacterized protein LOC132469020 [Gadus macrocephalus]
MYSSSPLTLLTYPFKPKRLRSMTEVCAREVTTPLFPCPEAARHFVHLLPAASDFNLLSECMDKLNLRNLVSISMDGPNVNWKLFDLFQKDQAEQYGGLQLVCVGSCGLHTLHNSFKCGFTVWQLDKLLRAMHTLFHNTPAKREDYITVTKSSVFRLSFCAHRWVENLPVVERALAVWPSFLLYMEAVKTKRLPNPGTASYDTVAAAIKDPLVLAKLQFYAAIARTFNPFLKKYQTDEPVLPFLPKDLTELMMVTIYLTL